MSSELPPSTEPVMPAVSPTSSDDVNALAARVAALETRFSPNSWVFGTNFLKRAFAIYGHVLVASFLVVIIVSVVVGICSTIFGLSMLGLSNR